MAMSAANHARVSQAGPSARHSFQVMTPETRSDGQADERGGDGADAELDEPKIQRPTVTDERSGHDLLVAGHGAELRELLLAP